MTADEIRAEIEKVEFRIFCEECADFMDWQAYYSLKARLDNLKKQLVEIEG